MAGASVSLASQCHQPRRVDQHDRRSSGFQNVRDLAQPHFLVQADKRLAGTDGAQHSGDTAGRPRQTQWDEARLAEAVRERLCKATRCFGELAITRRLVLPTRQAVPYRDLVWPFTGVLLRLFEKRWQTGYTMHMPIL